MFIAADEDIESKHYESQNVPRWFAYKETLESLFDGVEKART